MSGVAIMVSRSMRAVVIDKTGVAGTFHFNMVLSREAMPPIPGLTPPNTAGANSDLLSLSDALQDQLGLRTESARGPPRCVGDPIRASADRELDS
jgi:uncharacterized protein (TIGR03435 family)